MPTQAPRQTPTRTSFALSTVTAPSAPPSLALTAPLSPEDLMVQSCPEASPAKWHLAHTTWFFETFVLREFLPDYREFHPDFHWLFNSYYNSLGDMPAKSLRASFSRPPLADILAYRTHVDAAIARLLDSTLPTPKPPAASSSASTTSSSTRSSSPPTSSTPSSPTPSTRPTSRPSPTPATDAIAPPLDWLAFTPGLTQIGFAPDPTDPESFSFDNETPRHSVFLAPFALATRLVTCAEYLAFMDDNGYTRPELWLSDGWTTVREQAWQAPLYWQRDPKTASGWRIFTLRGWQPLEDLSETPVCHLSFFEADAFARWSARRDPGCRLPTEFEWEHAAAVGCPMIGERSEPIVGMAVPSPQNPQSPPPPTSSNPTTSTPPAPHPSPASSRSSATYGSGPPPPTSAIPATTPSPAPSASTTASSCPPRWSSAAAPASPLPPTSAPPTVTSSRPQHPLAVLRPPPRPRPLITGPFFTITILAQPESLYLPLFNIPAHHPRYPSSPATTRIHSETVPTRGPVPPPSQP